MQHNGGKVRYLIGCDIGGTFTDIVIVGDDGSMRTHKISSTPHDYSEAILTGIADITTAADISYDQIDNIVHASTIATNTILEERGARTALITTRGFRDVLEMRRLRVPVLYDLDYKKPAPLALRRHRFEITERMDALGRILEPLNEDEVRAAAIQIRKQGIEAVAICFLHSYANLAHELQAKKILTEELGPDIYITCSSELLPEIREYERTSTAVVNSYIGPVVRHYLDSLRDRLMANGHVASLRIMQSNGGVMSASAAAERPAYIVESGPAAGVIACARIAVDSGYNDIISFDMGGTTAKAAIIENGKPALTTEYEVGAGINISSKLVKGGGYPIKLPFIDISEIGAGGGSLVTVDLTGSLKVGPRSAGSVPGPVCYGLGGTVPTFTDATVALGYLNPAHLVGGKVLLNSELSLAAIQKNIAKPMGLSVQESALGIFTIAVATMTRAVKAVSTYIGRDPRSFILTAFGGNGPIVATSIAQELGMKTVLIPPSPGVFSALGLVYSNVEHSFTRTMFLPLRKVDISILERVFHELEQTTTSAFEADGFDTSGLILERKLDLRYKGQAYELTVTMPRTEIKLDHIEGIFHAEHLKTYGHSSDDDPVDLVNIRVIGECAPKQLSRVSRSALLSAGLPSGWKDSSRNAYFGHQIGLLEVPVITRKSLDNKTISGPCIVEELDATTLIPPNAQAHLDDNANILINL